MWSILKTVSIKVIYVRLFCMMPLRFLYILFLLTIVCLDNTNAQEIEYPKRIDNRENNHNNIVPQWQRGHDHEIMRSIWIPTSMKVVEMCGKSYAAAVGCFFKQIIAADHMGMVTAGPRGEKTLGYVIDSNWINVDVNNVSADIQKYVSQTEAYMITGNTNCIMKHELFMTRYHFGESRIHHCLTWAPTIMAENYTIAGTYIPEYIPTVLIFNRWYLRNIPRSLYLPREFLNAYPEDTQVPVTYQTMEQDYASALREKMVYALPCPPGSFMSCREAKSCVYAFPVMNGADNPVWQPGDHIHAGARRTDPANNLFPINKCYPCIEGKGLVHYENSEIPCTNYPDPNYRRCRILITTSDEDRMYCPGADYPPLLCRQGLVSNSARNGCVCKNGHYDSDPPNLFCEPCEKGYYCLDSVRHRCPNGQYQDQTGATACLSCESSTGQPMRKNCAAGQAAAKCSDTGPLIYQQGLKCVPCGQCINNLIGAVDTTQFVGCYIDTL